MTKEETKNIIGGIIVSYPNYKPVDLNMAVQMWQELLADYDYQTVSMALKVYITTNTSGFAPSIGQILQIIRSFKPSCETLSETQAWSLVSKALRNSTYHAQEEFDLLPIEVQKAVGSPNMLQVWAMDESYNESVVSSNFMRSYKAIVKRQEEYNALPGEVKKAIGIAISTSTESQLRLGGD